MIIYNNFLNSDDYLKHKKNLRENARHTFMKIYLANFYPLQNLCLSIRKRHKTEINTPYHLVSSPQAPNCSFSLGIIGHCNTLSWRYDVQYRMPQLYPPSCRNWTAQEHPK